MKATIASFRRGKHVQTMNQMVLISDELGNKEDASKWVGKGVVFLTAKGNAINGKVTAAHGNSGALRALFEKGMPGQSLGKKVEIK